MLAEETWTCYLSSVLSRCCTAPDTWGCTTAAPPGCCAASRSPPSPAPSWCVNPSHTRPTSTRRWTAGPSWADTAWTWSSPTVTRGGQRHTHTHTQKHTLTHRQTHAERLTLCLAWNLLFFLLWKQPVSLSWREIKINWVGDRWELEKGHLHCAAS